MKRLAALTLAALFLVGCGDVSTRIGEVGDATRQAAELQNKKDVAAIEVRQAKIIAQGQELADAAAKRDYVKAANRYQARRNNAGWAIYDTNSGQVAKLAGQPMEGLTEAGAYQAYLTLRKQQTELDAAVIALQQPNRR